MHTASQGKPSRVCIVQAAGLPGAALASGAWIVERDPPCPVLSACSRSKASLLRTCRSMVLPLLVPPLTSTLRRAPIASSALEESDHLALARQATMLLSNVNSGLPP